MENKRTVRIEVNLTEKEAEELRIAAEGEGLKTATFVRIAALMLARQ
jgi:uncharacterized protein (DUF1778 family)